MIKAIIVDDEYKSCENLKYLIEEYCKDVQVIETCQSVSSSIKIIDKYNPDLVFLDVQMQDETGFDLLEHYKNNITFKVIFTTAHSEYAIRAIKFSALDYLLKPISTEELQKSISSFIEKSSDINDSSNKISTLIQNLNQANTENIKLALPTVDGLIFIYMNSIIYFEGRENYTNIHTKDNKCYLVSKTIRKYEDMLSEINFFRIHKSYLVNLNEVLQYIKGEGGQVVMSNSKVLNVSRRKKETLLKELSNDNSR